MMNGTGLPNSPRVQTLPLPDSQTHFPGSPYSVSVLKPGYCRSQPDGSFRADGTVSLISGPRIILVDTGGPWDKDFLIGALEKRDMDPGHVQVVVGTHGHSDHVGNLNLFPHALMIIGYDVSEGETYRPNKLSEGETYVIDEHVSGERCSHSGSHRTGRQCTGEGNLSRYCVHSRGLI
ncbi:metallo-beta-lactamase domain-containing protein 1 isoform X2 [Cheilinus undulatus]|uniref:metallo-beta-lactamase domain-containing protein 1 isoform X2 n=1 Tax=Cheilinus undulatus TaxID=241271 RepID=UPI001BD3B7A6|nr:metallo-beta-lactamase domain-containing protein 1 isoform X2 [Cheilinus undulatus]